MNNDELIQAKKSRGDLATLQQRKASNPLKSVWVEASAGTGKTKVLSDRVLRILLSGVNPSKILCLTYTKAAAVEMNSRIAGRLSRWAVLGSEELADELQNLLGHTASSELIIMARKLFAILLDTPGGMKIQTIHSFCQEILKRFPLEAKISPYFEVMDERTSNEALDNIKKKLLWKIEQEPEGKTAQALAFLTKNVSEFTFPKIMNSIAENRNKIARLLEDYSSLDELLDHLAQSLGLKINDSKDKLIAEFVQTINEVQAKELMLAFFQGGKNNITYAENLDKFLIASNKVDAYEFYRFAFWGKENTFRKPAKAAVTAYPNIVEIVNYEASRIQDLENKIKALNLLSSTRAVLFLAEDLIKGYNNYKKVHSKMDYEDLIVLTRNLLESHNVADWVLFKLDGGIDHVLIDEAQDTSPNQWAVVKAITAEFFAGASAKNILRTVFAVGDRKQSIYSFQGADPQEFEKMRHHFADKMSTTGGFEEVKLEVSFRSTSAVLDSVNNVFNNDIAKQGVVLEGQNITHIPFRIGDGGKVEIWNLVEPQEGENPDVWLPPVERVVGDSTSSRLAKEIAIKIKKMVDSQEWLVSQARPVRYSDFLILVQRRNSFVEELVRECKNADVNIAGIDKIKLLEQIAIQDLVALGRFLLLPTDDLTLAIILKSPLFGFDDDDLFELCYNRGGASLWSKLGDNPKYIDSYKVLQTLLNMADFIRPFELYAYVLNKLNGRKKFVQRMGYEVEDGLDEFLNLTLNFEQEHIPSLQTFINWIAKDKVEIKRELEQSDIDAVRIMTVHGSKGLQAPIVILPDTVRVVSTKREIGMLWDGLFYYPLCAKDYEAKCEAIYQKQASLELDEYRRLLYVALTRAEDRLCICGYRKKNKVKDESWYEICHQTFAEIGQENEDGTICYEVKQQLEPKNKETKIPQKLSLPNFEWLYNEPKAEGALARPLTPSKMEEDEPALASPIGEGGKSRYRRGKIIHKLLQFLPDIKSGNKADLINEFLNKNAPDWSVTEAKRVQNEVLELLHNSEFASVFGVNSRAEVPIMGQVDDKIISGQIDRLVVEENRVLIVDYKTNRPAAKVLTDVSNVYLKQMKAYKALIEKIYPNKKVQTLILWTDTAQLMEIPL